MDGSGMPSWDAVVENIRLLFNPIAAPVHA
jgi:hypothetical protein